IRRTGTSRRERGRRRSDRQPRRSRPPTTSSGPHARRARSTAAPCRSAADIAMASIHKELLLDARPDEVWSAVRDFGAPHEKLVPGVLVDSRPEPGARVVTFANGLVVRELLVELNDDSRRLCWTARGGRATHHNASMQVIADGSRTRLVWIT